MRLNPLSRHLCGCHHRIAFSRILLALTSMHMRMGTVPISFSKMSWSMRHRLHTSGHCRNWMFNTWNRLGETDGESLPTIWCSHRCLYRCIPVTKGDFGHFGPVIPKLEPVRHAYIHRIAHLLNPRSSTQLIRKADGCRGEIWTSKDRALAQPRELGAIMNLPS